MILALMINALVGCTAHGEPFGPPTGGPGRGRGPLSDVRDVGSFPIRDCTVSPSQLPGRNTVSIDKRRAHRIIRGNGIPDHPVGSFPNNGNPNTIAAQNHRFQVPLEPAGEGGPLRGVRVGVVKNGIPLDPATAEFWNNDRRSGWNYEALSGAISLGVDCNHAHVQPGGLYHYHGIPESLVTSAPTMQWVGYASDGYPLYARFAYTSANNPRSGVRKMETGYRLKRGARPGGSSAPGGVYDGTFVQDYEYVEGLGDLDACNGRFGATPEHGETYYYVLTDAFPFVPRCTRASTDRSFALGPPPGNGRRPPPPPR